MRIKIGIALINVLNSRYVYLKNFLDIHLKINKTVTLPKSETVTDSDLESSIFNKLIIKFHNCDKNLCWMLSKSESVKFSLIESVIYLFTDSSVKNIFHC